MLMPSFRVTLFGKFCAVYDKQKIESLDSYKVQELFCFLLLNAGQAHHREKLAGLLWEKQSATQSKNYLRRTLWQLQAALKNQEGTDSLIQIDSDWIQFNCTDCLWSDVVVFESAFNQCNGKLGAALKETAVKQLAEAVQMYKGDLLEGWYQDWCLFERERFRQMLLMMIDKLMVYFESVGAYEIAISHGMEILRYDLANERTHRKMMRLLFLCGDRTGALRQYERCKKILNAELGVQPSRSTENLRIQIEEDRLLSGNTKVLLPQNHADYLEYTLKRLQNFDDILGQTHQQILEEIQRVENTLSGSQK